MDDQGLSIRDRLRVLRRMAPHKRGLHLYRVKAERTKATKAATLFVYIRSHENTYALHETYFKKNEPLTPLEWEHYMRTVVLAGHSDGETPVEVFGVLGGAILPGVNIRSSKEWTARAVIGFVTHDLHKSLPAPLRKKWYKTESQGRKNGQGNLRRRHRNGARKAE